MRLDPAATIADIPALKIRALLQRSSGRMLCLRDACHALRLDPQDARLVLGELEAEDYLERCAERDDAWYPTVRGNALANASAAPPVTRATAQRALEGLLARAEEANRSAWFLYRVRAIVVFGSYLGPASRLNDVDVAVALRPRYADPRVQSMKEEVRWQEARRTFRSFTEMLFWPQTEVRRFLKARSRVLSVHELEHEATLIARVPHQVVFGTWEREDREAADALT